MAEKPDGHEGRLVAEIDQSVFKRELEALDEARPAAHFFDHARHIVRDHVGILPTGALVKIGIVAFAGRRVAERAVRIAGADEAGEPAVRQRVVPDVAPVARAREQPAGLVGLAESGGDLRGAPVVVGEAQRAGAGFHAPAVIVFALVRDPAQRAVVLGAAARVGGEHLPGGVPVDAGNLLGVGVADHIVRLVAALPHAILFALDEGGRALPVAVQTLRERADVAGHHIGAHDGHERKEGFPGIPERVVVVPAGRVNRPAVCITSAVARLHEGVKEMAVEKALLLLRHTINRDRGERLVPGALGRRLQRAEIPCRNLAVKPLARTFDRGKRDRDFQKNHARRAGVETQPGTETFAFFDTG